MLRVSRYVSTKSLAVIGALTLGSAVLTAGTAYSAPLPKPKKSPPATAGSSAPSPSSESIGSVTLKKKGKKGADSAPVPFTCNAAWTSYGDPDQPAVNQSVYGLCSIPMSAIGVGTSITQDGHRLGGNYTDGTALSDYAGIFSAETCRNSICAYSTFVQTALVSFLAPPGFWFDSASGACELQSPESVVCFGTYEWYLAG